MCILAPSKLFLLDVTILCRDLNPRWIFHRGHDGFFHVFLFTKVDVQAFWIGCRPCYAMKCVSSFNSLTKSTNIDWKWSDSLIDSLKTYSSVSYLTKHFDLILSIQKPFSTIFPVRANKLFNCGTVNGRTKLVM